ncbi:MAG: 50S ribosomal protein L29 [Deltaproteobacteria bacterium]|jgi:ribosomal protein L29|nr:50S ribosomal protein L29 [Deltaproteobacteria bacterium]
MADEENKKPATVNEASQAILGLRFQNFTNRLNNTRSIAAARRDLARLRTAQNAPKKTATEEKAP